MKKKGILIHALQNTDWIGGTYYKRNILFSLLQNEWICNNYIFVILSDEETDKLFQCFANRENVFVFTGRVNNFKLSNLFIRYNIRYTFPNFETHIGKIMGTQAIKWIPDFQHNVYPQNFSYEERQDRTKNFQLISKGKAALVLSSKSAKKDFEKYYPPKRDVYVIPFVSYVEPEIRELTPQIEQIVLEKYGVTKQQYVCVCNQFWKHKNHIVVLKSILLMTEKIASSNIKFVFTGMLEDYRDSEYYNKISKYMQCEKIRPYIKVIGFVDRLEQLALMKNARLVIQPSLFEGWGTVVEDAKVLDKRILLSDIPVHREQANEKCVLFNPLCSEELANKLCDMFNREDHEDVNRGIEKMYSEARIYSKEFEKILKE